MVSLTKKFSEFVNCEHGITTTSGTTALHLACKTLGIEQDDQVLVSSSTNMACAFSIDYCGAIPVPIDIEKATWQMDVSKIERKIDALLTITDTYVHTYISSNLNTSSVVMCFSAAAFAGAGAAAGAAELLELLPVPPSAGPGTGSSSSASRPFVCGGENRFGNHHCGGARANDRNLQSCFQSRVFAIHKAQR